MLNKKTKLITAIIMLTIVCSMMLSGCVAIENYLSMLSTPERKGTYYIDINDLTDTTIASVVANNCMPSAVRVLTKINTASFAGAGFVINSSGYVVTNYHCITEDGKDFNSLTTKIELVFENNTNYNASFVGGDKDLDIAVLKITSPITPVAPMPSEFEYLTFADSDSVYYGENSYTIGNPDNIGFTLSTAMVSSPLLTINGKPSIILDSTINHGNSGGALINSKSQVIGVVFARIESKSGVNNIYGIGCAIPSNDVMAFLDTLSSDGATYTKAE